MTADSAGINVRFRMGEFFVRLWNGVAAPHPSVTEISARRQAQLLAALSLVLTLTNSLASLSTLAATGARATASILLLLSVMTLVSYFLSRSPFPRWGSIVISSSFPVSAYALIATGTSQDPAITLYTTIPVGLIISSVLLPVRGLALLVVLNTAIIFALPSFITRITMAMAGRDSGNIFTLGALLIVVTLFRNAIERARLHEVRVANEELRAVQANLEQRVRERTVEIERRAAQIATGAQISRIASQELDPDRLLRIVVNLIGERFQFYYVGIFILDDEGRNAVLRAGTGIAGQTMLERGHQLKVGSESMVGWVCAHRQARIALDVGAEAIRFANPLLPMTRSEMALPLRVGEQVIGVLDIQSDRAQAFDQDDITALQGMADQIAVAKENARLFQQAQASLKEFERINRLLTGQAWQEYLRTRPADFAEFHRANSAALTPEEADQLLASSETKESRQLCIPLNLRSETIGGLVVERSPDQPAWTPLERDLLEAVAAQAAQAMDSVRLSEESQRLAAREQVSGSIAARMRESLDMDTVLRTAVQQIRQALDLPEVVIQLVAPPATDAQADSNGRHNGEASV